MGGLLYTHQQNLSGVRSPTCLGEKLDSSGYSSSIEDDEGLPAKSARAERYLASITTAELWDVGILGGFTKEKSSIVRPLPPTICSSPRLAE